jgi:Sperm-tail PG-rich repeat
MKTEAKPKNYSPGPGAYDPSIEYVKKKSPEISVKGRTNLVGGSNISPGPGAYN